MVDKRLPVVVIDDEPSAGMIISKILSERGYSIRIFYNAEDAITFFRGSGNPAIVFLDILLPGADGMTALPELLEINPSLKIVMMTAFQTVEGIVKAMKSGAVDFLVKPLTPDMVLQAVEKYNTLSAILPVRERSTPSETFAPPRSKLPEFMAFTPAMKSVLAVAQKFAESDETILIAGESGTGKELLANEIHQKSARGKKPFGVVDCASIPETLFESELFGYEKGAFTGADAAKAGRFELANGGSLFLDEIGNVPLTMQAKLLRFTEDHAISRLGGKKTLRLDIRLIAATNADLQKLAEQGTFREDLYYRLSTLSINLPPLRNRSKEEKELLVRHFLKQHSQRLKKPVPALSDHAKELILNYRWPGNVRELENALYSACLLCAEDVLEVGHFPIGIQSYFNHHEVAMIQSEVSEVAKEKTLRGILRKVEKDQILSTLKLTGGNKKKAAEILDMDYKNFLNKLKEYTEG